MFDNTAHAPDNQSGAFSLSNCCPVLIEIGLPYATSVLLSLVDARSRAIAGRTADDLNIFVPYKGDANGDGCVDDEDLLLILFAFGSAGGMEDLNSDGVVDDSDLLLVLFNFGSGC